MICDLCSANPNVVGNSDFLKGYSNFKKETVRKHAISNCHIRAREMSHSKGKSIAESQIAQSFSKINKDMQFQERKKMEAKINTAYFFAKEELPFSKFEGLLSLQRKNGVTLNNTYANNTSCAELVSFLSNGFRDDVICEVNSKNYFSLMADGAADFGGTENETVVCRLVRDGAPVNCILGHKAVAHAHAEGKKFLKVSSKSSNKDAKLFQGIKLEGSLEGKVKRIGSGPSFNSEVNKAVDLCLDGLKERFGQLMDSPDSSDSHSPYD